MPGVGGWASTGTVCPSKARLLIQIKGAAEVKKEATGKRDTAASSR
jgi:hypothetical protein